MQHLHFKVFITITCTNLEGSQKEGSYFLNLLQKEGVPKNGGFLQRRGDSNPGGNYEWISMQMWRTLINRMITKQQVKMNR